MITEIIFLIKNLRETEIFQKKRRN